MPEETRTAAAQATRIVDQVTAVVLAEPKTDIVPLEKAKGDQAALIKAKMAEVDITDTDSIVTFGSAAQADLQKGLTQITSLNTL